MNVASVSAVTRVNLDKVNSLPDRASVASANSEQIEEVAQQFESVFMSMVMKQMRATLEDGFFGKENSDSYGAMFDMFMGQHLSQQGGLGIRDAIVSQYERNQNL